MTLESKLDSLRQEWKDKPKMRTILEQRARLVKWAIEKRDNQQETTLQNAKDTLL